MSENPRALILAAVKTGTESGLCILPPAQDGTKRPLPGGSPQWDKYKTQKSTPEELRKWYSDKAITGIGLVCGEISGKLECLDFDERTIYEAYKEAATAAGLENILSQLEAGYFEHSPNGVHLLYRCETISGNTKLASRPKTVEEMRDLNDRYKTLIETRGEGGFIIIAPTYGTVNPAGNYQLISGSLATIPTITPDERKALHELARTFNILDDKQLASELRQSSQDTKGGGKPGDDCNHRANWPDILSAHRWRAVFTKGDTTYWCRPGKTFGISATTNHQGSDLLYVFSSSTPFEPNRGYTKFSAYTILNHSGDFSATARDLASQGYGEVKATSTTETQGQPQLSPKIKKMSELINTVFEPIRWVISGLLPEGLAILSGPPKIGKSWLVMNLCLATATGGYALGKFAVEAGEVLLLSLEDNERRMKGRAQKCLDGGAVDLDKFHAITTWRRLDNGGLDDLREWFEQHPDCKLVVIDTIQKIKPHPKRHGGTAYENDYDCYGDLQRLALEFRCCILVIHHNRKSDSKNDEDPLEQISGSTGITGAMDTILMLRRPRGAKDAVLTATGRDISESQYAMTFDGTLGQWIVSGAAEEVTLGDSSKRIVAFLKEHKGKAFSPQEVSEQLGGEMSVGTTKTYLYRLRDKGVLTVVKGRFQYSTKGVTIVTGVIDETIVTGVTPLLPPPNSGKSNRELQLDTFGVTQDTPYISICYADELQSNTSNTHRTNYVETMKPVQAGHLPECLNFDLTEDDLL